MTGIWETSYSRRISMAVATVSAGWVCTNGGRPRCLPASTSAAVGSAARRAEEAVVGHPLIVEDLPQVAAAAVGQQRRRSCHPGRTRPPRARAATTARPQEPPVSSASSRASLRVMRNDSASDTAITWSQMPGSKVGRPDVLAHALDQVGAPGAARVDRSLRIGADHRDPAAGDLLQVAPGAGDRPAGADARHEVGDPAVGLRPDLPGRWSGSARQGSPGWRTGPASRRPGSRAASRSETE